MSSTKYRPEIDGLRAVAVMGVVLFHAGLGVPGGYVGVDVFFVISGFLITSIILKNLKKGTFSLIDFWVRRIRRIIPAVSVLVLCVLGAGLYLLDPKSMEDLARSSMAQALMLANIYFWQDAGYFTDAAEYKPLLHTWTLAVEEQFYLFFPVAVVTVHKLFKDKLFVVFSAAAIASLALSIYFTTIYPSASFFLLPTRAWELLAGSLIAMREGQGKLNRSAAEIMSLTGLVMISASMFLYDSATPFPGYNALLPVVGSAAFIWGCQNHKTYAGSLLSFKPFVFLGLISYSLYLWHWPIFSFARFLFADLDTVTAICLIAISIVVSYISWKFVENPFRDGGLLPTKIAAFSFGSIALAFLFISSSIIWKLEGIPGRLNPSQLAIAKDISWNGSKYKNKNDSSTLIGDQSLFYENKIPDFVVWGDSHAKAYAKTIDDLGKKYGLFGEIKIRDGKIPITGLWRPSWSNAFQIKYPLETEEYLQSVIDRKVPNLILISRWAVNCDGRNLLEVADGQLQYESLVTDNREIDIDSVVPKLSASSVQRQLDLMLDRLAAAGVKVWLIKQVPEVDKNSMARQFFFAHRFPNTVKIEQFTTDIKSHKDRQRYADLAIDRLESANITVVDPSFVFYDNPYAKLKTFSDRSYYRDDNHLTHYGVEQLLGPFFKKIMIQIQANKK